jgi:lipoprotein NlpD
MRVLVLSMFVLVLVGCGGGYAPVYDQSLGGQASRAPAVGANEYRVRTGDTLFAIAFKLGVDYRELEKVNNIRDRNLIFAGQVLKVRDDKPKPVVARRSSTASTTDSSAKAKPQQNQVNQTRSNKSETKVTPASARLEDHWRKSQE